MGWRLVAILPLALALVVFGALAVYQLALPGLHYDEAKEAGVNAMQLLTGQPVTAFRDATVTIGRWHIPLMVQDYIGNLNVLLAVPFLAVGGVNTVALRVLPLILAALTLILAWKIAARLGGALAAGLTALLLAVNPSFVFWSRQGIFVTNITVLFFMAALWFGILWWQGRRSVHLVLTAFMCGLGVYAKLLFVWAVIAMIAVAVLSWLLQRRSRSFLPLSVVVLTAIAFAIPLLPLIAFNLRTGGTLTSLFGNLGRSYYGVDNSAYGANLGVRLRQVITVLHGSHFWYLGEAYANQWAPWLLLALVLLALVAWLFAVRRGPFTPLLPLALLILIVLQSAFTVSDLFITHFVLLVPLIPLMAGLSVGVLWRSPAGEFELGTVPVGRRSSVAVRRTTSLVIVGVLGVILALGWAGLDAYTTVRYHRILTISGGYAAHSDAIYHLADYLDKQDYAAPIALDWGIDAPVQFLTAGRVKPIDVFGYTHIDAPDLGFADRVAPYLADWQTIYVAHAPQNVVFKGRLEAMTGLAAERGGRWLEQIRFGQHSGDPVYIVHRFL